VRRVDHVQHEIGGARFLERRPERRDQVMRQLPDEADGIGEPEPVPSADVDLAREGVQCGEQTILHEDVAAREGAQEARLPGVGIADERGTGEIAAALALVGPVVGDVLEPLP